MIFVYNLKEIFEHYKACEDGRIYDLDKNSFVKMHVDRKGYLRFYCKIGQTDFQVHRFILYFFNPVENMENLQVNHIDGDKRNNNINNLEWCTPSENLKHAFRMGLKTQTGDNNSFSKLTENDAYIIIDRLLNGDKVSDIAKDMDLCHQTISNIKMHKSWTHLTKDIIFPNIRKCKRTKFND